MTQLRNENENLIFDFEPSDEEQVAAVCSENNIEQEIICDTQLDDGAFIDDATSDVGSCIGSDIFDACVEGAALYAPSETGELFTAETIINHAFDYYRAHGFPFPTMPVFVAMQQLNELAKQETAVLPRSTHEGRAAWCPCTRRAPRRDYWRRARSYPFAPF